MDYPDVVKVPADLFNVDVSLKRYPSSPEESALWLRVLKRYSDKARVSLAHLKSRDHMAKQHYGSRITITSKISF